MQRTRELERGGGLRLAPSAMAAIERELGENVGARERLLGAAAKMRLALLDHLAVRERHADVAGELVRIGIGRVDAVTDLRGDGEHALVFHRVIGEIAQAHIAPHERGRDAVRLREFPRIAVRGCLLGGERLPQSMARALADTADAVLYVFGPDAARREPARAIDVGMRHRPARIRLEGERLGHPALAEIADQRGTMTHPYID